ncbi:MAG: HAD family hydrolase [Candidatus Jacksonbacteria bacterium]|nr:HAD family hydrolase [Candidatus Jacksonbacteria bacterium]
MKSDINLFIFDWSGVISDDRKPVYETTARVLTKYGKSVLPFSEIWKDATMTPLEYYRKNGISENEDVLVALFSAYFNEAVANGSKPTIYADAPCVFEQIAKNGRKIAILSSHPKKFVEREAREYGIDHHITHVLGGSHNKETDLQNILIRLQIPNKHALYCGDTIYDIQAAKVVGIQSVGVASGYHPKEMLAAENPDFLFDTLTEITSLL